MLAKHYQNFKAKAEIFSSKRYKKLKLLPSVGIFLNIGKNCQKATLIWPDDQITRRRWAKIDVVGCMGCWWTKVDACGWRWMKVDADIRKWIQVNADGRRWTHVNAGWPRWTQVDIGRRSWTKVDEGGCRWMEVDAGGCRWRKVDACGWKWMQADAGGQNWMHVDTEGWKWMQVDTGGRSWTQVDTGGWRWTQVDAGGRRSNLLHYFYSLSKSICKVGLYNLNSVDLKDQLLSLFNLLKIFEMSLNYFWAYFSPITIIFLYFRFCTSLFHILSVISYFRFFGEFSILRI